jgi:hypothetical protein
MPTERTTAYTVVISRSVSNDGWVRVALRKQFWAVGQGTRSRHVAETGFWSQGMGEQDVVESALRELLRMYVDAREG